MRQRARTRPRSLRRKTTNCSSSGLRASPRRWPNDGSSPSCHGWRTFWHNHAPEVAAMDFLRGFWRGTSTPNLSILRALLQRGQNASMYWIKIRRSLAGFSGPGASHRFPYWADSLTATPGFGFSVHTRGPRPRTLRLRPTLSKILRAAFGDPTRWVKRRTAVGDRRAIGPDLP
jgi:hypothetical protein